MNYALGYAWKLDEIFMNFKSQNLKIDCVSLQRLYGDNHKKRLCYKVFRECVKLVVNDIIENDVEFQLPTGSRKTSLQMHTYRDEDFKKARKNGKFMEVDFLESNFIANQLQLYMYGHRNIPKSKQVYVNKELKQKITDYTNQGRVYYGKIRKTIKDYYEPIKNIFPKIPDSDLHKILNFGWKSLYLVNSYGGDVLISGQDFWFYIGILRKDSLGHFEYYKLKLRNKIKIMYKRKKIPWDGYYYFGLSEERYAEWKNSQKVRGRPRKYYEFGNIILYKVWEDCSLANGHLKYFFRMPYPIDMGFSFYNENLKTKTAEFFLEREPLKFQDILVFNNDYEFI